MFQTASDMLEKLEASNSKLDVDEEELCKRIQSFTDDELRQKLLDALTGEECN